jgi:hypothetical protein
MQDLTGRYPAYLAPTSQSAGGAIHASDLAMTAPGSQPVDMTPVPTETLPMPQLPAAPVPVVQPASNPDRGPAAGELPGWDVPALSAKWPRP